MAGGGSALGPDLLLLRLLEKVNLLIPIVIFP